MGYNPEIHKRRSIRLKGYDYSQAGSYFITICCQNRECRFGKIENTEMILNEYGIIAYNEWAKLPERFPNFELDVFQIMPNHMHGIVALQNVGAGFTPAQNATNQNNATAENDIGQSHSGQPQGIAPYEPNRW
jgi:putative transposase